MNVSNPIYRDVQQLGRAIAEDGWDAIVGGHQGLMAAFSTGIRSGGGSVRGVTLECFPTPPDNHLNEEVRARDFFHRMQTMIENTDAYIALPGGLGTLSELAMTWDLLAINILEPRPLVLYGPGWPAIIEVLQHNLLMSVDQPFSMIKLSTCKEEICRFLANPS